MLRARQLSSVRERRALASCLTNILDAAEERAGDPGSRLVLDQTAVIAARTEILALIELLQSRVTIDARAIALTRLLTHESDSPLWHTVSHHTLPQALAAVLCSA